MVALAVLGQFQLGAHPVGACHQQGLAQACRQPTEAPEAAEAAEHLRAAGGFNAATNAVYKGPAGLHIHPCGAVVHGGKGAAQTFPC